MFWNRNTFIGISEEAWARHSKRLMILSCLFGYLRPGLMWRVTALQHAPLLAVSGQCVGAD